MTALPKKNKIFLYIIFAVLIICSCAKKEIKTSYNDRLSSELKKSLQTTLPNFDNIAPISNQVSEFNLRFHRLYNNQKFIVKINKLLAQKKFLEASKELNKKITSDGKTIFTNYFRTLFQSAQAIDNYNHSLPFEDRIENAHAIAHLENQTKNFIYLSVYNQWLTKQKDQLKQKVEREIALIHTNLELYSDLFQTYQIHQINTAFLLAAYILPQSPQGHFINDNILITLENPLTEYRWLQLHTSNNTKNLMNLLNTLEPMSLTNLLTRIQIALETNNNSQALKHLQSLLNTKLIGTNAIAKIIQKHYQLNTVQPLPTFNFIINNLLKL